jgi:hypothetical protein
VTETDLHSAWTTGELQRDFIVEGFAYGLCVVRRRSDNVLGSLRFCRNEDNERVYYGWEEHHG